MCVPSFNFVAITVLEKCVKKIYLITGQKEGMRDGRNDGRNDGRTRQIKYSPTSSKRGSNNYDIFYPTKV